jgi:16S rRNA (guanine527-N7)-methyltransferase
MNGPDLLRQGCQTLGLSVDAAARQRLLAYARELLKWNRRFNLVARGTDEATLLDKHFLDCLTLLPLLTPGERLLDVGSGAGFPGLVLAAARPELTVTLVEPRQKRVGFLRHVVRTLGLERVTVQACRLEELEPAAMGASCLTGRAVAEPVEFLRLTAPWMTAGARMILMSASTEGVEQAAEACGLRIVEQRCFRLPASAARRALTVLAV